MDTSPIVAVGFLLFLVLLALAPRAISRSPLRLKAALQILAGMAAGFAAGTAVGALSGSGELAGHLAFLLMWCGGIWVSVRKIRRAKSTGAGLPT
jgi:ABC-type transport system involved in cytochrome c biogenesis permease subunit